MSRASARMYVPFEQVTSMRTALPEKSSRSSASMVTGRGLNVHLIAGAGQVVGATACHFQRRVFRGRLENVTFELDERSARGQTATVVGRAAGR